MPIIALDVVVYYCRGGGVVAMNSTTCTLTISISLDSVVHYRRGTGRTSAIDPYRVAEGTKIVRDSVIQYRW